MKNERIFDEHGRQGERHTTTDVNGNEVIEDFFPEMRPMKLEKRIVRQKKEVVAQEIHQSIRDGEVVLEETLTTDQDQPLQIVSRIGTADHGKVIDGDYVRKDDIGKLIEDGVVTGITALMERMEPAPMTAQNAPEPVRPTPFQILEQRIEQKNVTNWKLNLVLGSIVACQIVGFVAYIFLW